MEATPDQADASAHERFSAECFNACWELIEKDERTPEDDEEMLNLAHASAWHWSKRPDFTPSKRVIALWQLSRVNSLLGQGEVALGHAARALEAARDINASLRPPPPAWPISRRPACSAMTVSERRTKGRTSAARRPSLPATRTTSYSAPRLAMT